MIKYILLFAFTLLSAPAVAEDTPDKAEGTYVFIFKSLKHLYWQSLKQGVDDVVRERGITAKIMVPTGDTADEHLNLCQVAIAMRPKIIVMGPATTAIGLECFKQAEAKGIKVADLDATITPDEAKKAGVDLAFTIGADNIKIGETIARHVVRTVGKPDPSILILEGVVGSPPSTDRVAGFRYKIETELKQGQIIASIPADWDRLKAMNTTADILTRTPNLDVIFAANDTMAIGAAEAAKTAGKKPMIIGVDGTADARRAVLEGRMNATLTQLPYLIGKRAAEKAIDVTTGQTTAAVERTNLLVLTKAVLELNSEPLLKYVK